MTLSVRKNARLNEKCVVVALIMKSRRNDSILSSSHIKVSHLGSYGFIMMMMMMMIVLVMQQE